MVHEDVFKLRWCNVGVLVPEKCYSVMALKRISVSQNGAIYIRCLMTFVESLLWY